MSPEVVKKVEKFFSQYRLRRYSAGQVLILNGDKTDYIYYILSGKVKEYDVTYRGDEVILHVFKPPAFFPMSQAINKTVNNFIYEAETDIEIRQAPSEDVVTFIQENPDVMFDLLSRLYKGMDSILGRTVQLMTGSAKTRLMYELLEEARRFGLSQPDGSLLLNINEKELGARAGLSRETVSRELHKIMGDNLVLQNKSIIVKDIEKLKKQLKNSL
jgi:CRP/FNR family transcriptional regulator